MKKFEYKFLKMEKKFTFKTSLLLSGLEEQLNEVGKDGWELISIEECCAILKREINS